MLGSLTGETSFFASGRDALASLLTKLPYGTVHLPDLICQSVYQACQYAGKEVRTYQIEPDLINTHSELCAEGSCIIVMHYFGVANEQLIRRAKSLGMTVISDVTHMLFNPGQMDFLSSASDYLVASLRKSGPFPDGGFISSRRHRVPLASKGLREAFFTLRTTGLFSRGFSARQDFINDENFALLRKAESLLDQSLLGDFECSYLSMELLRTIGVDESARKMIKNISMLSSKIIGSYKTICTTSAPSPYYVCLFENQEKRDLIKSTLTKHQYFFPVHWDTHYAQQPSLLSDLMFSIPCDTRYNEADMESIALIINSCLTCQK